MEQAAAAAIMKQQQAVIVIPGKTRRISTSLRTSDYMLHHNLDQMVYGESIC